MPCPNFTHDRFRPSHFSSNHIDTASIWIYAALNLLTLMILVHNHPSGDPSPSREDIAVTERLVKGGKILDIPVLDHVILGRFHFASLKEKGLMRD